MMRRDVSVAVAAAALLLVQADAQRLEDERVARPRDERMDARARRSDPCGVDGMPARLQARDVGARTWEVLPDGSPVSFEQDPRVLTPEHRGTISLRDFLVAGDVGTARFKINDPDASDADLETWQRAGTRTVNGRLVSVFHPQWSAASLARVLRRANWGFDSPMLFWGEFLPEGVAPGRGYLVRLRFASTAIPDSYVQPLAGDVQYSSHVANVVLPGFGESRLGADDDEFDWPRLTRRFYEEFEDSYDTIAVVMQDVHLAKNSAFHFNVRNDVQGIGARILNQSSRYNSARLRSLEMYYGASVTTNRTSAHELAHQWGSYFDWNRIAAGWRPAGHQPQSHDPLLSGGETLIGAVLDGTRRVTGDGGPWQVERTSGEIRFHPLTRYAMGILPREAVPALTLFDDQGQFGDDRFPAPGTSVAGTTQHITISHIAAVAGERRGPVDTEWRRAIVVVSPQLLTAREMSYWNFFAQRLEDANAAGVVSYEGFPSFDAATGRAIDLRQDIRPRGGSPIVQPLPVDEPEFGPDDFRDVRFDAPVPSVYRAGQTARWSGRLTAGDRNDYHQMAIRFWKYGGTANDAILARAAVTSASSFQLQHEWLPAHRGRYLMELFLFWPGAAGQVARVTAGPIIVH